MCVPSRKSRSDRSLKDQPQNLHSIISASIFCSKNIMLLAADDDLIAKSHPTFATPWTVAHQAPLSMGILQARILEWVAISFSRGSSRPRNQT